MATVLVLVPLCLWHSRPLPNKPEPAPPVKIQENSDKLTLPELQEKLAKALELPLPEYDPAAVQFNPESEDTKEKKVSFNYGAMEASAQDVVRLKGAKIGIDYHVDDRHSVGVEGSQQIYDRQDAKAWDRKAKDESTAEVKYKLKF